MDPYVGGLLEGNVRQRLAFSLGGLFLMFLRVHREGHLL